MRVEIDIDAKDLAFARVYADSIGMNADSLIREILKDWVDSVAEQITGEILKAMFR